MQFFKHLIIYIYMCVCVCVCVCGDRKMERGLHMGNDIECVQCTATDMHL